MCISHLNSSIQQKSPLFIHNPSASVLKINPLLSWLLLCLFPHKVQTPCTTLPIPKLIISLSFHMGSSQNFNFFLSVYTNYNRGEVACVLNWVPPHKDTRIWWTEHRAPRVLNLSTRIGEWSASRTTHCPLDRRLGSSQNWSRHRTEEKLNLNILIIQPVALSL